MFYGISKLKFGTIIRVGEDFLDSNGRSRDVAHLLMKTNSDDQIHIEQLEIWTRIGVPASEQEKPQRLIANITLWPFLLMNDLNDDLTNTANYSAVCDETKKFVQDRQDRLIETLADATAMFLLRKFPVHKVRVELRKFVLADAAYASVIVTRSAALE
jgi:dihydroneopterin aldolase